MKKILMIILMIVFGMMLWQLIVLPEGDLPDGSMFFINRSLVESGSENVVSAILFDFRAFDTLLELCVLFTSTVGVMALFVQEHFHWSSHGMQNLTKAAVRWIIPPIFLFSFYLLSFDHGFQGGVIMAIAFILLAVVYGSGYDRAKLSPVIKNHFATAGGLGYIFLGLIGLWVDGDFLTNLSGAGGIFSNYLLGLNFFSGIQVAGGLGLIFYSMLRRNY